MRSLISLAVVATLSSGCTWISGTLADRKDEKPGIQVEKLKAPPGYAVTVLSRDVPKAREMALAPGGMLFLGSNEGNVYVVKLDGSSASPARVILKGMKSSGVAYANGALFVADRDKIHRYDNILTTLEAPKPVTIVSGLPEKERHAARFMAIGPDGKLYISVGSPCNVCEAENDNYGTIIRVNTDGSGREVVARGIRNTVGFDWNPKDGSLWFSENGQDELGPDQPNDELNRVSKVGENFGFPYCHAGTIPDPKLGTKHSCSEFTPPVVGLGAHVAALGMRFVRGDGTVIIARHGSHPPSRVAYDVVRLKVDGTKAGSMEPFLTGFLQGREYWGRPADVLPMADGSVLVADDLNGAIYRVAKN
ncbi:MAG: PQQ-dependent sugar dehydrogenase [Usitatibacter sp.]